MVISKRAALEQDVFRGIQRTFNLESTREQNIFNRKCTRPENMRNMQHQLQLNTAIRKRIFFTCVLETKNDYSVKWHKQLNIYFRNTLMHLLSFLFGVAQEERPRKKCKRFLRLFGFVVKWKIGQRKSNKHKEVKKTR